MTPITSITATADFFRLLYGDTPPGVRAVCRAGPRLDKAPLFADWFPAADAEAAAARAVALTRDWHVWHGVGLQANRAPAGSRGSAADVIALPGLWADIDVAHPVHKKSAGLPATIDEAMTLVSLIGLTPTVVVETGHGLQVYWCFLSLVIFENAGNRERVQAAANRWKATIAYHAGSLGWKVDAVADFARLLRIPGTVNIKDPADPRPVRVLECSGIRYDLFELEAATIQPREPERGAPRSYSRPVSLDDRQLLDKAAAARNGAKFRALWGGDTTGHGGDHSAADFALVDLLAFWTNGEAGRIDRLFRASGLMRDKWDRRHYANGDSYGRGTIRRALADGREGYDPTRREVFEPSAPVLQRGGAR